MEKNRSVLDNFHPLVATWFAESIGTPTEVQSLAWRQIVAGDHVLITAPTGSGKTMAAFLWAVNGLITGKWPPGQVSVLYVSPLKALNNDIRRNLTKPLSELKTVFARSGAHLPPIQVAVRSGDTPQAERRSMLRNPPEILITTPESLNLLLSSHGGRSILANIRTVIMDEIHAVVGDKRGVHLITAVDRLVSLCGEFQRIALSATVRPLETVARFVGGFSAADYSARPVRIVSSAMRKDYRLAVRYPEEWSEMGAPEAFWRPYVRAIKEIISRNRSTLIFANSRRLCEKITYLLNVDESVPLAYAHHGSLAREIRTEVERKLKAGKLRAIVATNSLELGIDIGPLDEVVLLQAPPALSSAIQRIGRAGHRVGEESRGTLLPTDPHDILHTAVMAGAILGRDIEAVHPVLCPLDVLAQIIVSMTGMQAWNLDDLYGFITTSYPYRPLSRLHFDLVVEMLAGRYAGSRLRELKPRIAVDRLENRVSAGKGALQALYFSGGVIPDRGYFHLRHNESGALLGELDEEFVWEAKIGQVFTLSTQNWKIERITHNDVFVTGSRAVTSAPPFWKAEENLRDSHFSQLIAQFLESADELLDSSEALLPKGSPPDPGALRRLADLFFARSSNPDAREPLSGLRNLDRGALEKLVSFLAEQKGAAGILPHRHHLLVEHIAAGPGGYPGNQIVLHTVWGGRMNRPFAMALEAAWEERYGYGPEIFPGNDSILFQMPHEADGGEILSLVTSANLPRLIRRKLEGSGFFGARFRECAGRALLLPRRSINERMPLWLSRLRSQRLLESVLRFEDFPILLEAWRTCLNDELDLEGLTKVLSEFESGVITWSEVHTERPSPMARSISWPQINRYMYRDDQPRTGKGSGLRADLLRELISIPELRPAISSEAARGFELKRQRLSPGYSPDSSGELVEWVKERLLLPESEWETLLGAMRRDHQLDLETLLASVSDRLVRIHPPGAAEPLVVAVENIPRLGRGLNWDLESLAASRLDSGENFRPSQLGALLARLEVPEFEDREELFTAILSQWLQFYGPGELEFVRRTLGLDDERSAVAVEALIDAESLISGRLLDNDDREKICDSQNYEMMLRISRAAARPVFSALPIERLQSFLARWQGLASPKAESGLEGLFKRIDQLVSYAAPAELWEEEIFPARLKAYDPSWLDTIMQQSGLRWIGMEGRRVAFSFEPDLDLLREKTNGEDEAGDVGGPYDRKSGTLAAPAGQQRPQAGRRLHLVPDFSKTKKESVEPSLLSGPKTDDAEFNRLFSKPGVRYGFSALSAFCGGSPANLADTIWREVFRGNLTNDTFASLRHGIENNFRVSDPAAVMAGYSRRRHGGGRAAFSMWKGSLPMAGNWMRVPWPDPGDDLLEKAERDKERVRLLLDRYGILFRELLQNELPAFSWRNLFKTLRLMELSGELLTGYFFEGVPGPQFISKEAFRMLQAKFPRDCVYWICATDPASLCGIKLDALKGKLPRKVAGNHLVYQGTQLVMESRRNAKELVIYAPEDSSHLPACFGLFHHLLTRRFQPMRRIVIETCTGISLTDLEHLLRYQFDVVNDGSQLNVFQKYGSEASKSGS
ncbi:MAG: DEAD/DEAH box helicase [Syntrophobacteraceae bacterium]|nr:DEAD/DEAH box helicase [Syntrophobacteraceae bacterium]